ncbi:uncharacterized protein LOC135463085 [Liolophura sinensis]|uniref:uncharacterized protein LOC135463085 n=1 Tax=Liolophura sinensis TaxID=3198878 RepID=UPI003159320D
MLFNVKVLFVVVAICALWAELTTGQDGNPRRQRRPGARRPGGPRARQRRPNVAGGRPRVQGNGQAGGQAAGANRSPGGGRPARPGIGQPGTDAGRQGAGRANATGTSGSGGPFCQKIMVPMCKGQIGYEYTRLPNQFGHRTQGEVMETLEPFWPFMDMDCSPNFRLTACATYLPKCIERRRLVLPPCRQSCMKAKRQCRNAFSQYKKRWPSQFNCARFPRLAKNRPGVCVPPSKRAPTQPLDETTCVANTVPLCSGFPHFEAFIPNMFWQSSLDLISRELGQYQELVDTGCNPNLSFFLCGIYLPFCQDVATEFAVPCREVCEQVRADCEDDLQRTYGINWPGKLQCHRYPTASNDVQQCVHPNATEIERTPDPEDEDYLDEE